MTEGLNHLCGVISCNFDLLSICFDDWIKLFTLKEFALDYKIKINVSLTVNKIQIYRCTVRTLNAS